MKLKKMSIWKTIAKFWKTMPGKITFGVFFTVVLVTVIAVPISVLHEKKSNVNDNQKVVSPTSPIPPTPTTGSGDLVNQKPTPVKIKAITLNEFVTKFPQFANSIQNNAVTFGAFQYKDLPADFILPESITDIGMASFAWAKIPDGSNLPSGVKSIGTSAFLGATLPKGFTWPPLVTSINSGVFSHAKMPEDFSIPHTVTSIGSQAFDGANLPVGFTIPSSVKYISSDAFEEVKLGTNYSWTRDGVKVDAPTDGGHEYKIIKVI